MSILIISGTLWIWWKFSVKKIYIISPKIKSKELYLMLYLFYHKEIWIKRQWSKKLKGSFFFFFFFFLILSIFYVWSPFPSLVETISLNTKLRPTHNPFVQPMTISDKHLQSKIATRCHGPYPHPYHSP